MEELVMLTKEGALRAYAAMINTQDTSKLESLLADDFHYASQWVFAEIDSKQAYLDYIKPKLLAVRESSSTVWAEMAHLDDERLNPCVVMAQGQKDNLVSLVLAKVANGKITRLDMCGIPAPHSTKRSGDYPSVQASGAQTPRNQPVNAATSNRQIFNHFVNDLHSGKSLEQMSPAMQQWWRDRY